MKVLIIGSGGREHALAWKVAQSDKVSCVYVAPGNAGTELEDKVENIDIGVTQIPELIAFAQKENIELTIVGPEVPLVLGVVDDFKTAGLAIFGPSKGASQLEGSKAFSKDFLSRHHIPTAAYQSFTEIEPAVSYIKQQGAPIVVKADCLAAGKGVILADTVQQAIDAVEDMLAGNAFGDAGHRVVIEEFLMGEEASFIVMADGKNVLTLATSQDHKARDNGDKGPNTGGMGAYSPAPVVTDAISQKVIDEVIQPTIDGMAKEGHSYTGFLYAGLMISPQGDIKVLEYNCRFGDPETQPIMMRLNSDLSELCLLAIDGQLDKATIKWDKRPTIGVVMAAGGYPGDYDKGHIISGLDSIDQQAEYKNKVKVFHAGTNIDQGKVNTTGGRVLCVVAIENTVTEAQKLVYQAIKKISWDGAFYRTDIAYRAVAREAK
jgi:phosphoribosylamine--glycine ligase